MGRERVCGATEVITMNVIKPKISFPLLIVISFITLQLLDIVIYGSSFSLWDYFWSKHNYSSASIMTKKV